MTYPIIDLEKLIAECDPGQQVILNRFKSLSDASIETLRKTNDYDTVLPIHFIGLSQKSTTDSRNDLKRAIDNLDHQAVEEQGSLYREDQKKYKSHTWYVNQKQLLSNPSFWHACEVSCQSQAQLDKLNILKEHWQTHSLYSHYTSQALVEVSGNIIPLFENYFNLFKLEFKHYKHRLPFKANRQIKYYLKSLESHINKEKEGIINAMWARLMAASHSSDITYDDVTLHLARELKSMGLLKEKIKLPRQHRHNLDPATFDYFHRFIIKHGSENERGRISELSWYQRDSDHNILPDKRNPHRYLVVPKVLEGSLKTSFLQRLFRIEDYKQQKLREEFHLITQLRFIPKPEDGFEQLAKFHQNRKWSELCQLADSVAKATESAERRIPRHFLGKLFQKDKIKFLRSWQRYLTQRQEKIAEAALDYADYLAAEIKSRLVLELDRELLCSTHFQAEIKKFNTELLLIMKAAGLGSDHLTYQDFQKQYEILIALPEEIERAKIAEHQKKWNSLGTINEFVNFSMSNTESIDSANETLQEQCHDHPSDLKPFQMTHDDHEEECVALLGALISDAKNELFDIQSHSFKQKADELSSVINALDEFPIRLRDPSDKLHDLIKQVFCLYLKTLIAANESDFVQLTQGLSTLESILEQILPPYLQENLRELSCIRQTHAWFTFQAKCNALLVSLTGQDSSAHLAKLEALLSSTPKVRSDSIPSSLSLFFKHKSVDESDHRMRNNHIGSLDDILQGEVKTSVDRN